MKYWFFVYIFFSSILLSSQENKHCVYLIGDAGEYTQSGEALLMLKKELLLNENSTVVFLGDNVYPSGLNLKDTNSVLRLKSQLGILNNYRGNVFFIPGNHDWDAQKSNGLNKILEQQKYIQSYLKDSTSVLNKATATFLPQLGLPGPSSFLVTNNLRIIFIDTQWFLHFHKKNKLVSQQLTKTYFYKTLDSLLNYSKQMNQKVIIAAHHPIYTNGLHSKSKQPMRFLINYTPFAVFGWLGLNRLYSQDINSHSYIKMRKQLVQIFSNYENLTYVSGHEHNLQYFKINSNDFLVSGCGSKLSKLRKRKAFNSNYQSDSKTGFIKLSYQNNKQIEVYRVGERPFVIE